MYFHVASQVNPDSEKISEYIHQPFRHRSERAGMFVCVLPGGIQNQSDELSQSGWLAK